MHKPFLLIIAVIFLALCLLACADWDIDRSGFMATATASVRAEMTRDAMGMPQAEVMR